MAIKRFRSNEAVHERSDSQYECAFVDAAGVTIEAGSVTAITATLSDMATGAIINSRDEQDVLNAAGGTLGADGTFTLLLGRTGAGELENDNIIVGSKSLEEHRLVFEITFTRSGGGTGHLNHEVRFFVQNIAHVP